MDKKQNGQSNSNINNSQGERMKFGVKRVNSNKNTGSEKQRSKNQDNAQKNFNEGSRTGSISRYTKKLRDSKGNPRAKDDEKLSQNPSSRNAGIAGSYKKSNRKRENITIKHIEPKREETVEDIIADTERIEKDIQFEIKQIKTIKLGL
jgi:hypothetical protein